MMRAAQRPAGEPGAPTRRRVACAPGASIALHEHRAEHATGPEAAATAACSELLLTLRGCAQRHGADIAEHDRRSPVNLARNYYDGGRDFDVLHTLALTFMVL